MLPPKTQIRIDNVNSYSEDQRLSADGIVESQHVAEDPHSNAGTPTCVEKAVMRRPSPSPMKTEVFTARECAAALHTSYATVLRLIKRRKLRCLPLRKKLVPREELERFLREEIR